jgi:hypothetical protein
VDADPSPAAPRPPASGEDGPPGGDESIDTASVTIAAGADTLWDMVSDVTRMGEWSPECTGGRWIGKQRSPVVGARFLGFNRRGVARWFTTNVVVEAERGRAFAFRTRETGVVWGYRLEPDGDGGTTVTERRDLSQARMWVIRLAGPFVGGMASHADEMREGMGQTLTRLKHAAESGTSTA